MSRGLGRGLDALLPASAKVRNKESETTLFDIAITHLNVSPYQPRKNIVQTELDELTLSIKAQGIIQPLIVRKLDVNNYEIVAGERRWRAAQQAGLITVPCVVRELTDQAAGAIALIENMQREDLSAIEEAEALERLTKEFNLTHQQMADALGKSRTTISNLLRLNQLTDYVKKLLSEKNIEMGHARAILSLEKEDQIELANQIIKNSLTVRKTEQLVKNFINKKTTDENSSSPAEASGSAFIDQQVEKKIKLWQSTMKEQLSVNTAIKIDSKGKGRLIINFEDQTKLMKIIDLLK